MARALHRYRQIRIESQREINRQTRIDSAPGKVKARDRRDANIVAKIKALGTAPAHGYSPEVQSWLSRQIGKPFAKVTAQDIAAAIA